MSFPSPLTRIHPHPLDGLLTLFLSLFPPCLSTNLCLYLLKTNTTVLFSNSIPSTSSLCFRFPCLSDTIIPFTTFNEYISMFLNHNLRYLASRNSFPLSPLSFLWQPFLTFFFLFSRILPLRIVTRTVGGVSKAFWDSNRASCPVVVHVTTVVLLTSFLSSAFRCYFGS